jgi:long-chain acyl-CoA synthetase
VQAVVVAADGRSVDPDALIAHCRDRIAGYKKPRSIVFADDLPRRNGAVDYQALDDRYGGGGYPGASTTGTPRTLGD